MNILVFIVHISDPRVTFLFKHHDNLLLFMIFPIFPKTISPDVIRLTILLLHLQQLLVILVLSIKVFYFIYNCQPFIMNFHLSICAVLLNIIFIYYYLFSSANIIIINLFSKLTLLIIYLFHLNTTPFTIYTINTI